MVSIGAIQMTSSPDVDINIAKVKALLPPKSETPQLVVLPECFSLFGAGDKAQLELAQHRQAHILSQLQQLAKAHNCWLVAGTLPTLSSQGAKFRAASYCINNSGEVVARYDKIHLFDVSVEDNTGSYRESRYTAPGTEVVCVDSPFGKIGMAVCYDIRFAGLFQAMGAIDVLVLPSAFTQKTGQAHWHALLQARSIELQCYVVGADQWGTHENERKTYGNSVIYSPWGEQLACIEQNEGYISASLDSKRLTAIRQQMPVYQHRRFRSHFDQ